MSDVGWNGQSKRGRRHHRPPLSQINVTPLVDVMLVLLIVFMVAAPLLTVGVAVDLPRTDASALQGDQEPLSITVNAEGKIFIQDSEVELAQLEARLIAIAENGYDQRIYVRGDRTVDYGQVMRVMGTINAAGFTRVGLVTESDNEG